MHVCLKAVWDPNKHLIIGRNQQPVHCEKLLEEYLRKFKLVHLLIFSFFQHPSQFIERSFVDSLVHATLSPYEFKTMILRWSQRCRLITGCVSAFQTPSIASEDWPQSHTHGLHHDLTKWGRSLHVMGVSWSYFLVLPMAALMLTALTLNVICSLFLSRLHCTAINYTQNCQENTFHGH